MRAESKQEWEVAPDEEITPEILAAKWRALARYFESEVVPSMERLMDKAGMTRERKEKHLADLQAIIRSFKADADSLEREQW